MIMNGTILIVEDDMSTQAILQEILQFEGYSTLLASNGKEALDLLSKSKLPCLVILDLMMPVMSGWEFQTHKQKNARISSIPTIVTSASNRIDGLSDVSAIMRKPIDLVQVLEAARKYCPLH